ncbi:MAG: thioredoxin domain-containing protein [Myxococcaceae bacterium]|nr:thioredoxin domain-containing protein [Myxococcaceae bacterium]
MSTSPLERLVSHGGTRLDAATVDGFLANKGPALVLFTGDPKHRAEAQDVAVVAQELARNAGTDVSIGVVDVEGDQALQQRFGVSVFPSVVFLRDGQKVSMVARVQDWAVYAQAASLWLPRRRSA